MVMQEYPKIGSSTVFFEELRTIDFGRSYLPLMFGRGELLNSTPASEGINLEQLLNLISLSGYDLNTPCIINPVDRLTITPMDAIKLINSNLHNK
jgi:hypothetical protein